MGFLKDKKVSDMVDKLASDNSTTGKVKKAVAAGVVGVVGGAAGIAAGAYLLNKKKKK